MRALRQTAGTLNPEARRKIGEALRTTYGNMLAEPVPRRHLYLLQRLEEDDTDSAGSGESTAH